MANILVIGAAGGVGSAVTGLLIARGENVTGTVLDESEKEQVNARFGECVKTNIVDLGETESAVTRLSLIVDGMGTVDAVAVCAAISPYGPVESTPLSAFRRAFEINTLAGIAVFQAVMPALRRTSGRIVFISSMAGRAAMPFIGAYVASKYALEGISDVMRREARPQGVLVSLVEPGAIRTGMMEEQLRTIGQRIAALSPEEDARYGYLYRAFQRLATDSYQGSSSTAEQVARIVMRALYDPKPHTRYVAGGDAQQLLAMADAATDHELDAALGQMFGANEEMM